MSLSTSVSTPLRGDLAERKPRPAFKVVVPRTTGGGSSVLSSPPFTPVVSPEKNPHSLASDGQSSTDVRAPSGGSAVAAPGDEFCDLPRKTSRERVTSPHDTVATTTTRTLFSGPDILAALPSDEWVVGSKLPPGGDDPGGATMVAPRPRFGRRSSACSLDPAVDGPNTDSAMGTGDISTPAMTGAADGTDSETRELEAQNAELRRKLMATKDALAKRRQLLRSLAGSKTAGTATTPVADIGLRTPSKDRTRWKRQVLLTRHVASTRRDLCALREEVVAAQSLVKAETVQAMAYLSHAIQLKCLPLPHAPAVAGDSGVDGELAPGLSDNLAQRAVLERAAADVIPRPAGSTPACVKTPSQDLHSELANARSAREELLQVGLALEDVKGVLGRAVDYLSGAAAATVETSGAIDFNVSQNYDEEESLQDCLSTPVSSALPETPKIRAKDEHSGEGSTIAEIARLGLIGFRQRVAAVSIWLPSLPSSVNLRCFCLIFRCACLHESYCGYTIQATGDGNSGADQRAAGVDDEDQHMASASALVAMAADDHDQQLQQQQQQQRRRHRQRDRQSVRAQTTAKEVFLAVPSLWAHHRDQDQQHESVTGWLNSLETPSSATPARVQRSTAAICRPPQQKVDRRRSLLVSRRGVTGNGKFLAHAKESLAQRRRRQAQASAEARQARTLRRVISLNSTVDDTDNEDDGGNSGDDVEVDATSHDSEENEHHYVRAKSQWHCPLRSKHRHTEVGEGLVMNETAQVQEEDGCDDCSDAWTYSVDDDQLTEIEASEASVFSEAQIEVIFAIKELSASSHCHSCK